MKATVRDGTPIAYEVRPGRVAAQRLLLVHSLGPDCSVWEPVVARIGDEAEILVGEEDYATPLEMARALEAAIPGARLTVLPQARHLTTLETPDAVAALVRRLIGRGVAFAAERRAGGGRAS